MQENHPIPNSEMRIPDHAIERIARCLLPRLQAFFEADAAQQASSKENSSSPVAPNQSSRVA